MSNPRRRNIHTADSLLERCVPEPNTGCWLWLGGLSGVGYPLVAHDGKVQAAHRLMFRLCHGEIPGRMLVCHKCDVPACINPAHLFLGSYKDNVDDMHQKGRGRHPRGSDAGRSILVESQVTEIRKLLAAGERHSVIAARFGISAVSVSGIKCGRTWQHLKETQ